MKNKTYLIKIASDLSTLYSKKKKFLVIIGKKKKKSLKLRLPICLNNDKKTIEIKTSSFFKLATYKKNELNALKGTTAALIKQAIIETSYSLCTKLRFVGVGYRIFDVDSFENKLFSLKLGYSHSIFFKIDEATKIFSLKRTKLFIWSDSYQALTKTAAFIRECKKPELYKGKGILYETEKINLKVGKKA